MKVPGCHQKCEDFTPDAYEATKIGEQVKDGVSCSLVVLSTEVHLNSDHYPNFVGLLIGHILLWAQREQVLPRGDRPSVQVENFQILRRQVCRLQLIWHNLACLTADRDVEKASLFDLGFFKEVQGSEPDLVVEQDNELSHQPLSSFLFTVTIVRITTFAHPERDC